MNWPQADNAPAADIAPPARPRIGLALGSGSARGLAHIGVLRALKEARIDVDVVAGTSMGAVIGAVFASGKIDGLTAKLLNLDWQSILVLLDPMFPRSGLIDGQKIAEFVRPHVPSARIEDLLLPFAAVATDITNGEQVVATTGDLTEAVRASIAVPGIVTPVRSNGRILVDGGLVNPVPVQVRQTWLDVEETCKRLIVTQSAIAQAEENLLVARDRYANGLATHTEVLDAETLRTGSESNHANALFDAALAGLRLKRATGEL